MCELRGNHVALLSIFTHPKSCHWDTGTANLWPCACPYGLCWKLHRWSRFLFGINWLLSSYCSCFLNVLARDIVTASVLTHGKQNYSYMEKLSFNWLNITYGNLIVLTSKIVTLHHYRLAVLTYDHYFNFEPHLIGWDSIKNSIHSTLAFHSSLAIQLHSSVPVGCFLLVLGGHFAGVWFVISDQ